jgi:hypothetical protein
MQVLMMIRQMKMQEDQLAMQRQAGEREGQMQGPQLEALQALIGQRQAQTAATTARADRAGQPDPNADLIRQALQEEITSSQFDRGARTAGGLWGAAKDVGGGIKDLLLGMQPDAAMQKQRWQEQLFGLATGPVGQEGPPTEGAVSRRDAARAMLKIPDPSRAGMPADFDIKDPMAILGMAKDWSPTIIAELLRQAKEGDQNAIAQLNALQYLPDIASRFLPPEAQENIKLLVAELARQAAAGVGAIPSQGQ